MPRTSMTAASRHPSTPAGPPVGIKDIAKALGVSTGTVDRALHAKPGMTDAYQIIAVCSCSLKDADGATRAYARLDEKSRNLVHSLCQKNGISVGAD